SSVAVAFRTGQPVAADCKLGILQRARRATDTAFHFMRVANQILPVLVDRRHNAQTKKGQDQQQSCKQRQPLEASRPDGPLTHLRLPRTGIRMANISFPPSQTVAFISTLKRPFNLPTTINIPGTTGRSGPSR